MGGRPPDFASTFKRKIAAAEAKYHVGNNFCRVHQTLRVTPANGSRLLTIAFPGGTTTTTFTYDYRGRRITMTDQNNEKTTYAYDAADRMTSVTDANQNVTQYSYDTENNLLSIEDANTHTTTFTYDSFGRVTKTTFQTFTPTWYADLAKAADERHSKEHRIASPPAGYQVFGLLFRRERCKSLPVSFLLKRREWRLTIEGRSPFEEVLLPPFIPKKEAWLLSGAIVAEQTSNTLAGLFYLRSFIEQFARRQTGITDRKSGEEILDANQALLPEGKRDHMPSLRFSYEKLSVALHAASPDDKLFKRTLDVIIEHFDYRRMYKIPDEAVQNGE
jgi:YD repeat-containing protein